MTRSKMTWLMIKTVVFFASTIPFLHLASDTIQGNLGANPLETLHFRTGDWALRFLMITLALTPLKLLCRWRAPLRFRRMFGLFSFFYASLHVFIYVGLEQSFSLSLIIDEVPKSPYIVVGLISYLLLVPLAITSTSGMMRRLGVNWKKLHRSIYLIAILSVIHFLWLVKADIREPLIYALIVSILLGIRVIFRFKDINNKLFIMPTLSLQSKSVRD